MHLVRGKGQDMATLIELSALLKALVKKGVITVEEVEAEVPGVMEELKQMSLLAQAKVPDGKSNRTITNR